MANTKQLLQLASLISGSTQLFNPSPNSPQARFARQLQGSAQSGIQGEILKEQKEAQEEEDEGALGGSLGSLLGAAAGTLIPGVGNVAGAALGSALGGTAGSAIGGGDMSFQNAARYGAQGAMAAGLAGMGQNQTQRLANQPLDQNVTAMLGPTAQPSLGQEFAKNLTTMAPAYVPKLSGYQGPAEMPNRRPDWAHKSYDPTFSTPSQAFSPYRKQRDAMGNWIIY